MKNIEPYKNRVIKVLGLRKRCKISIKQCGGFSKNVYKIKFLNKAKKLSVAIKKLSLDDLFFYKNILEKYKLNAFKLSGSYKEKDDVWIISEWVDSKKIDETKIYKMMVAWLIKKDKIFTKNHKLVKNTFNRGDKWWGMISKNKHSKILPPKMYNKILSLNKNWHEINLVLKTSPQTICHNDFEPKNTLVSKNDKFYVFDWSKPSIGSLFIDLARLVNTAPLSLKENIINGYRKNFNTDNFDFLLETARKRDYLSVFAALCNHINNGYKNEVSMKKFIKYANIISCY